MSARQRPLQVGSLLAPMNIVSSGRLDRGLGSVVVFGVCIRFVASNGSAFGLALLHGPFAPIVLAKVGMLVGEVHHQLLLVRLADPLEIAVGPALVAFHLQGRLLGVEEAREEERQA